MLPGEVFASRGKQEITPCSTPSPLTSRANTMQLKMHLRAAIPRPKNPEAGLSDVDWCKIIRTRSAVSSRRLIAFPPNVKMGNVSI